VSRRPLATGRSTGWGGGWGAGARRAGGAGAPDGVRARVVLVRGGLRLRGGERRVALARGLAQRGHLRRPPSPALHASALLQRGGAPAPCAAG